MDSVGFPDVVRPLAVLSCLAVLTTVALMAVSPPLGRVFPAALYGYFAFSGIRDLLPDFGYQHIVAYGAVVAAPVALHRILRRIDRLRGATYALAIAVAIASATFAAIAPSFLYASPPAIAEDFRDATLVAVTRHGDATASLPDIIYMVPDRYPSAGTLDREFGMDNRRFYAALRTRGFAVSENAHANYPKTFLSLASTLNGGYLESFAASYGAGSGDKRPVHDALEDNLVQKRLRQLGYRFHNYGNWWEPTRVNRWADVNDSGYATDSFNLSEFERALLRKTPTLNIVRQFADFGDEGECRRIQRKFQRLEEVGNGPEPVFVFAHMLVPHDPITMDASGRCLDRPVIYAPGKAAAWAEFKAAYIEYLKYFNAAALRIIDRQTELREEGGRKLLFVIQSDEGPFPLSIREAGEDYDFSALTRRELKMKIGIVNALRVPGASTTDLASMATPINNWRIIFNALIGSRMKMLPHNTYIYPSEKDIYRFCDVTDLVIEGEAQPTPCED